MQQKKWETARGIGYSYGYNRNETNANYSSFEKTLFPDFIDAVSKNGNLLLNAGPDGGKGAIPTLQEERLAKFRQWLGVNGEAVYGSKPWSKQQTTTDDNQQVRFTSNNNKVYATHIGRVTTSSIRLKDVRLPLNAQLVSNNSPLAVRHEGRETVITFDQIPNEFSPVLRFSE